DGAPLARSWGVRRVRGDGVAAGGPEALGLPDAEDEVDPVAHRDVLALAVDVDVAGGSLRSDSQVAAYAIRAEAEVAQRIERAELDRLARERLRDDRPGHVARVLGWPVVVQHPRDDR